MEELYPNGGYIIAADLKQEKKGHSIGYLIEQNQKQSRFPYELQLKEMKSVLVLFVLVGRIIVTHLLEL